VKVAMLRSYHRPLELAERPVPKPDRPDQVLVRVGAAGVCATDLHALDGLMEPAGVALPLVLGHESAGWVEAAGDLVSTVGVGDPVIVYPQHTCGLCVACRRGNDMHCERAAFTGLSRDGGFAEYVLVSERSLIKLPDGLAPVDVAPHADAGITAYHAVKKVAHLAQPGTNAVVIGVGGVGHIVLQLIRELGSSRVIAVDVDARRRELAAELGADEVLGGGDLPATVRSLTGGAGADLVFDLVGTDQSHADSMAMLARQGTYVVIGYGGTVSAPSVGMVVLEHSVVANIVGTWAELFQLHHAGRVTLRSQTYPLEEVNEVLAKLRAGEITGRAILVPE
jgi:NAD+-dependent secondary alcohol dehydrogenase Adh1